MNIVSKIANRIALDIRRGLHKKSAYDYPSVSKGWEKYETPLIGGDADGTFYDPFVRNVNGSYIMFVSHRDTKSIVRCDSTDGIHWSKPVCILKNDLESTWEKSVNRASFVIKDGVWHLWYTGVGDRSYKIGLAISKDGYHFDRYKGNPILTPSDIFEKNAVMNPCVIWDDRCGLFKMWYAAGEQFEPDVLCYASSEDGIIWEKSKSNPILYKSKNKYDCYKVGGCDVLKVNNAYYMFYIGYENIDTSRICVAQSINGIDGWIRLPVNPIISPTKYAWDADSVYKPSVIYNMQDKEFMLWYNGRKNHMERIGLASYKKTENKIID